MKNIFKSAAVAAVVCLAGIAQATTVSGNIGFTGQVNLDTASVGTATKVVSWVNTAVNGDDGSFAGIAANTPASFAGATPWSFNSGALAAFWTTSGFTFNLTSSLIAIQTGTFLGVTGTGFVSGNGYTATPFSWSFTAQNPAVNGPQTFTFSASTNAVPDGGTTAALLGCSLVGLGFVRRKMVA